MCSSCGIYICGTVCSCDFIEWILIYIGIIFGIVLTSFGWLYFRLCFLVTIPFCKIMSYFDLGWDSVDVLYGSTFTVCILSFLASTAIFIYFLCYPSGYWWITGIWCFLSFMACISFHWTIEMQRKNLLRHSGIFEWRTRRGRRVQSRAEPTPQVQTISASLPVEPHYEIPVVIRRSVDDMWVGLDQIENDQNSTAWYNLPDEVRSNTVNNQPARTPVYDWNSSCNNEQNGQIGQNALKKSPQKTTYKSSNLKMLDLIDVENDNDPADSQKFKSQLSNEKSQKKPDASQNQNECKICFEKFDEKDHRMAVNRHCGHVMGESCWRKLNGRCAFCNKSFSATDIIRVFTL